VRLEARSKRKQALTLAIPQLGTGTLIVALKEPSSGRLVCRRQFPVTLSYTPLAVEVLRPHYRNSIFATQKVEALELRVTTAVAAEERQDYRFEFALLSPLRSRSRQTSGRERSRQQGWGVLKAQEARVTSENLTLTIPLPKLRTGDYPMEGRLRHRNGKVLAEWQDTLRVLPPHRGEVRFDENWATLVDGQPFVPFGAWGSYRTPQRL
jgi:hypothetical protein